MTVRALTLLTKREGMSRQDFREHWRTVHAPIGARFPHLIAYHQHLTIDTVARGAMPAPEATVDGISELVFATRADLDAALASPEAAEAAADAANFMSQMRMYIVESTTVVDDGQTKLPLVDRDD
ncbi:EthD domain-containing protein [Rhodococcus ruber]|uniref:EthD domain-containing protein n=1 Tax=Rhodococcus ruber TaxID=1830 RepID=A0ABT4ME06_9NOCA|nr:EthD domain-containing protein [Rhodococcus ruber]MCZ4518899.1 EthD domain-containing protein [Rhodococcus ruber]